MSELSIREIGEKLVRAGRLKERALCAYGSDDVPAGAVPMTDLNRCAARAIFTLAVNKDAPPIYMGEDVKEKCCPGGLSYFGYAERHPKLKYFLSSGTKDFRGGAAEYLKATPEAAEEFFQAPGRITPLGKHLVVSACQDIEGDPGVRSILLFGNAESIRSLCGLIHFRDVEIFTSILMPGGASCASFITYAAGMAEKAPRKSAYLGPVDPTGNDWFPPNYLSLSVPVEMARRMAEDVEVSFITRRAKVAFPEKHQDIV